MLTEPAVHMLGAESAFPFVLTCQDDRTNVGVHITANADSAHSTLPRTKARVPLYHIIIIILMGCMHIIYL